MSLIIGYDSIGTCDFYGDSPVATGQNFDFTLRSQIYDEVIIENSGDIFTNAKTDWNINTYLLAKFQGNIEAGNVSLGGLDITQWKIRRRKITNLNFLDLDIVEIGQDDNFYYLDKTPQTSFIYQYEVIPMSGDIMGEAFTTQIECKFDYWWITDNVESYPLFANLEVSDINTNTQRHVYDGFDQFPTISYGSQKYQSGSITTMMLDGNLDRSKTYRDNLVAFINNQKQKIIKSPKGDIWIVDTHTESHKFYTEITSDDVSQISFNWMEVAKVNE